MNCPHCPNTTLVMSDRQGIEIDYCPQCRGVWLDRGELDKLIDRSAASAVVNPSPGQGRPPARPDFVDSDYPRGSAHGRPQKNWLSDIFD